MANEITYSSVADLRVTSLLHRQLHELVYDPTDLRQICTKIPFAADGSIAIKVPQIGSAYALAAPGEQTAPSNTAHVDASFTLTPARYALKFNPSDIAQISSPSGALLVDLLCAKGAGAIGQTATDLICALAGGFSNSVGSGATNDLTVANIMSAIYQLRSSNVPLFGDGAFKAVLAHHSFNEFQTSMRSETGVFEYVSAPIMGASGPGYQGRWNGVDFWSVDSMSDSAGATQNMMVGPGAIAWTAAPVTKVLPGVDAGVKSVDGGEAFIATRYDVDTSDWKVVVNWFPAFAEAEDARGVLISSDDAA